MFLKRGAEQGLGKEDYIISIIIGLNIEKVVLIKSSIFPNIIYYYEELETTTIYNTQMDKLWDCHSVKFYVYVKNDNYEN